MTAYGLYLLLSTLFLCFSVLSALVARAAAQDARQILRDLRTNLNALDLEQTRQSVQIKRLTSSVGALGRWSQAKPDRDPDALPDPNENPDKWRAAIRARAMNAKHQPKGELQ